MSIDDAPPNAVARMLGVLGDEWTLLIMQRALLGARRYGDFLAELPISHAVLSQRLRLLTAGGLLESKLYQTAPPRSIYGPTAQGRALWPVLTAIWDWERRRVAGQDRTLPAIRHTLCDNDFLLDVRCGSCRQPANGADVAARWGPSGSWARSIPATTTRRRAGTRRGGASQLFPQTMSVLGDRWSFALLVAAFVGMDRFTTFQRHLGAPPGTLADRLGVLSADDILATDSTGYRLTDKGRALFPVLVTALAWAQHWHAAPEGPAVLLSHLGCGRQFVAQLHCDRCDGQLRGSQIVPSNQVR